MLELPPEPTIIVTASRIPDAEAATPASVSLLDADRIERLGAPLVIDLLRLVPSVAVSVSGPAGSLSDVRIRGAEANHSLLFIDDIRANDPAAGNIPRFELVNADLASRIEVVRGPQSALWGSEAIGGVVAVEGPWPGDGATLLQLEGGSFGSRRAAARTSIGDKDRGLSLGFAGQRARGIDSLSGNGERDGYRNLAARASGQYRVNDRLDLAASGFAIGGLSEFDGYDPLTFARADTLDATRNRLGAGRSRRLMATSARPMSAPRPACCARATAICSTTKRPTLRERAAARWRWKPVIAPAATASSPPLRASGSALPRATPSMAASLTRTAAAATSR